MKKLFFIFSSFLFSLPCSAAAVSAIAPFTSCSILLDQVNSTNRTPTETYLNLIRSLVNDKNAINSDDIKILLNQNAIVNPVDILSLSLPPEQLYAYKIALDKIIEQSEKDPLDWEKIKEELARMSDLKGNIEAESREAKIDTREILYPFIQFKLPKRYKGNQGSPFGFGTWNGKSVIVGHLRDSNTKVHVVGGSTRDKDDEFMIDPVNRKVIRLVGKEIEGRPSVPSRYLRFKDKDYFYRLSFQNMFYSLDLEKNVDLRFSNLITPEDWFQQSGFVFNDSNDSNVRAIRLFSYRNTRNGQSTNGFYLVESNFTDRTEKPKVLADFNGYGMEDIGIDFIGDSPIVSYLHSGSETAFFYNVKTQKTYKPIKAKIYGSHDDNSYAAVYMAKGPLQAIFPIIDGYAIANIETGKILKRIFLPGHGLTQHGRINVTELEGHLLAYNKIFNAIVVIDLDKKTSYVRQAPDITSDVAEFNFKGRKYLTWGTNSGSIEVYDPVQKVGVLSSQIGSDKIYQVLPFEQGGRIFALIAQWNDSPMIVQLAGSVE